MATFTGNGQRLVGNDGRIFGTVLGTEVDGDDSTPLPVGRHLITAVAGSTGWPASAETGAVDIQVGYIIEFRTGDTTITPATGDSYVPLTETQLCDISGWSLEFSADEIDVTTLCDTQKVYEVGKTDVTGSVSGIVTLGQTDSVADFGLARRFMDIVRQSGGDDVNLFTQTATEIFAELVVNADTNKGDYLLYYAPVNLFGFSLAAASGAEAQTFESSMRIGVGTAGAADVAIKPALYRFARGA
jgi:hypothetical protein